MICITCIKNLKEMPPAFFFFFFRRWGDGHLQSYYSSSRGRVGGHLHSSFASLEDGGDGHLRSYCSSSRGRGDGHLRSSLSSLGDGEMAIPLPSLRSKKGSPSNKKETRGIATSIIPVLP